MPTPLERLEALSRQMQAPPAGNVALNLSPKEIERYSIVRALTACREKDASTSFEREISLECWKRMRRVGSPAPHELVVPHEILQRDLQVALASAGGFLTGDPRVPTLADAQRPRGIVRRAGATIITGLSGDVLVARQTGTATVKWLTNEVDAAAESQQTVANVALTPKTVSAYTEVSRQLWTQAPVLAELLVRRDLAGLAETALDAAALAGSGASGQPLGIVNSPVGTFTGASIAWSGVLEAQTDVFTASAAANPAAFAYVTTPAVASLLAQRQGFSTLEPIWRGALDEGSVAGARAFSSTSVPSATILLGDWSQFVVAEFGPGIELRVNPYANFPAGIIGVVVFYTLDVGMFFPNAFSVATSVS